MHCRSTDCWQYLDKKRALVQVLASHQLRPGCGAIWVPFYIYKVLFAEAEQVPKGVVPGK